MSSNLDASPSLSEAWLDAALPRLARIGAGVVAAWLALMLAWVVFAPISGAVVASGIVKVDTNRKTVTHRDGGIVQKILVREGDMVAKDQALVLLEDVRIDASLDLLTAQLATERLRRSRLMAEAASAESWSPPSGPALQRDGARLGEVLARERSSFLARKRTLDGQIELLRRQITETEGEMAAREREQQTSREALALMREELAANQALTEKGYVNRTRVLGLRRAVAEYESRIDNNQAELAKARQKKSELETRIKGLRDNYTQNATDELREATDRIIDLEEKLRAGRDASERKVIAAPVAGRLVDLRVNTPGSAVGPREPIVDIVPQGSPLVIEARVGSDAISDVAVGMAAEVRLLPYRYRSTELLLGTVIHVSADALADRQTGVPYFQIQVEVPAAALKSAGDLLLLPGMAAEVYVKSEERSPLQFLMDPITTSMRKGFREH